MWTFSRFSDAVPPNFETQCAHTAELFATSFSAFTGLFCAGIEYR